MLYNAKNNKNILECTSFGINFEKCVFIIVEWDYKIEKCTTNKYKKTIKDVKL